MEATSHARFQRYGSRKVAQVLDQIRGQSVWKSNQILLRTPRSAALLVSKAVRSASANLAVRAGKKLDLREVKIRQVWVGQGPMSQLRRLMPGPMGRAHTFKRKVCHVTVVVSTE